MFAFKHILKNVIVQLTSFTYLLNLYVLSEIKCLLKELKLSETLPCAHFHVTDVYY
jgi:hypothetical protein